MPIGNDHLVATGQIDDVHRVATVVACALRPRGEPVANLSVPPRARPEVAAGAARGGTDASKDTSSRVPRPDREIVGAVKGVILVPDQPAPVEGAGGLVGYRMREPPDAGDPLGPRVDP